MQRDQAHRTNELLERIAIALEKNNKKENGAKVLVDEIGTNNINEIPGFEGTLDQLNDLCNIRKDNTLSDKCLAANCDGDECTHNDYEDEEINDPWNVHNDFLNDLVQNMNHIEYLNFHHDMAFGFASSDTAALNNHIYELEYEECLDAIQRALLITGDSEYIAYAGGDEEAGRNFVKERIKQENTTDPYADDPNLEVQMNQDECCDDDCPCNNEPASDFHKDPYSYDNDLNEYLYVSKVGKIKNDSDHDIRVTAAMYEDDILANGGTKKECILDYVTNEFGSHGARYTDIIKFAYYLGAHNAPKYTSANRGYYSCAFSNRYGGHLISAGSDYFVKGINKEGKERYFALSFVESATDYWKRIS